MVVIFKELEIFLMNDQPTTCVHCGARCEVLGDFMHTNSKRAVMQCYNEDCMFIFIEEEEMEFINRWKQNHRS